MSEPTPSLEFVYCTHCHALHQVVRFSGVRIIPCPKVPPHTLIARGDPRWIRPMRVGG